MSVAQEAALVDYEEDDEEQTNILGASSQQAQQQQQQGGHEGATDEEGMKQQGNYVAVETAGFRDFYLKPELIRALGDAGFEHPSEVQHEAIPHAITGVDILCQAKSGMGKTAVFVLSVLHQLEVEGHDEDAGSTGGAVECLVIAHARELAFQIKNEFDRFRKHLKNVRCDVFYGGIPITKNIEILENPKLIPHILIGTPGRLLALIKKNHLITDRVKYFILDECDKCLEKLDMRRDVQDIFIHTPRNKQVMMLTATLNSEIKEVCRRFMKNPVEVIVDDEAKLTLHGLLQYYVKLSESEKNRTLSDLLDRLEFNQVIIFVKNIQRCIALDKLLNECSFPSIPIHAALSQQDRINNYHKFKNYERRIMVATDLFSRGIDIERVNIVINYDMPESTDSYLHRVGRAGRFGTKGLAITFIASQQDSEILNQVQSRFEAKVDQIPDNIDSSQYINQ